MLMLNDLKASDDIVMTCADASSIISAIRSMQDSARLLSNQLDEIARNLKHNYSVAFNDDHHASAAIKTAAAELLDAHCKYCVIVLSDTLHRLSSSAAALLKNSGAQNVA